MLACDSPRPVHKYMISFGKSPVILTAVGVVAGGAGCAHRPRREPEQSSIRYELAVDYLAKRRVEPALEELQKSLALDPENADAHNLHGLIALQQGAGYVAQAEAMSCLQGKDAEIVRRDATQKFREADQHLHKAVEIRPEFPGAWNNLAVAALQLQEYDAAIHAARNALRDITYTEPEVARANLGWAFFHKKDLQNAWKELHEASARAPGFCVGRYRLAKVYMERKEYDLAADEVESVIGRKECPIQEAYLLGGLIHERKKDSTRARELFARCTELAPRSCLAAECKRYTELIQ